MPFPVFDQQNVVEIDDSEDKIAAESKGDSAEADAQGYSEASGEWAGGDRSDKGMMHFLVSIIKHKKGTLYIILMNLFGLIIVNGS